MNEAQLQELSREADRIVTRISNLVSDRDSQISRLNPELRPEVLVAQRKAIEGKYQGEIDQLTRRGGEISAQAADAGRSFSRAGLMARARFSPDAGTDAVIRGTYMHRAQKADIAALLALAEVAKEERLLALADVVTQELRGRSDISADLRARIEGVLGEVPAGGTDLEPMLRSVIECGQRCVGADTRKPESRDAKMSLALQAFDRRGGRLTGNDRL